MEKTSDTPLRTNRENGKKNGAGKRPESRQSKKKRGKEESPSMVNLTTAELHLVGKTRNLRRKIRKVGKSKVRSRKGTNRIRKRGGQGAVGCPLLEKSLKEHQGRRNRSSRIEEGQYDWTYTATR